VPDACPQPRREVTGWRRSCTSAGQRGRERRVPLKAVTAVRIRSGLLSASSGLLKARDREPTAVAGRGGRFSLEFQRSPVVVSWAVRVSLRGGHATRAAVGSTSPQPQCRQGGRCRPAGSDRRRRGGVTPASRAALASSSRVVDVARMPGGGAPDETALDLGGRTSAEDLDGPPACRAERGTMIGIEVSVLHCRRHVANQREQDRVAGPAEPPGPCRVASAQRRGTARVRPLG
jgi:hypothetical protein